MTITINNTGGYPEYVYTRYNPNMRTMLNQRIIDLEDALDKKESKVLDSIMITVEQLRGRNSIKTYVENLLRLYEIKFPENNRSNGKGDLVYILSRYHPRHFKELHNSWRRVCPDLYKTKTMRVSFERFECEDY